tara:strand:- start:34 stop:633 length:600 start_codon:yes stop_codon:yes gene_type:complete
MTLVCENTSPTGDTRLVGGRYIFGFIVQGGSDIIGKTLTGIRFSLKNTSFDSGVLTCKLLDSTDDIGTSNSLHTFGSINVSSLTNSYQTVNFNTAMSSGTIAQSDVISLEFESQSVPDSIYMEVVNSGHAEGLYFEKASGAYETVTNRSPYYCFEYSSGSGGSGGSGGGSSEEEGDAIVDNGSSINPEILQILKTGVPR